MFIQCLKLFDIPIHPLGKAAKNSIRHFWIFGVPDSTPIKYTVSDLIPKSEWLLCIMFHPVFVSLCFSIIYLTFHSIPSSSALDVQKCYDLHLTASSELRSFNTRQYPIYVKTERVPKKSVFKRHITSEALAGIADELSRIKWYDMHHLDDCCLQADFFYSHLNFILDKCALLEEHVKRDNDRPWVSVYFKQLIKQHDWPTFRTI